MGKIYFFDEGGRYSGELLGLKGANLCEMSKIVDVPEGFILSTKVSGNRISEIEEECINALRKLEEKTRRFYNPKNRGEPPLLLAIRGSPTKPVPGLMHSMLNVGINDEIVEYLAEIPGGSRRFALDTYQRFLQMFGCYVLSSDPKLYDDAIKAQKSQEGVTSETDLSEQGMENLVRIFKLIANVPQDPMQQFWMIIQKLYDTMDASVNSDPEPLAQEDIKLAIIIQRMVFGNLNSNSGTGTCFSSLVSVGGNLHGNFLSVAEGNDANLNDHRNPHRLSEMGLDVLAKLESSLKLMEVHFHHNFQFVEYTIEDGHLFFLETNCVKSNPMYHNGNYLVSVENDVEDAILCDRHTDPNHPIPRHQYVLLKTPEISEAIIENPLFSDADTSTMTA